MIASINLVNSDANQWSIQISDATTGQVFSRNVVYNSTRSSGEWIVERPTINNQTSTLARFRKHHVYRLSYKRKQCYWFHSEVFMYLKLKWQTA